MKKSFHTVESHQKSLRKKFSARNAVEILTKTYQLTPVQLPMQTVSLQSASV